MNISIQAAQRNLGARSSVDVTQSTTPKMAENDPLLAFYRRILIIRRAEERLSALFADGEVPGFIHLSIGQEAVPVGVMSALGPADTIASTHRGHGHAIAKGLALEGFFAEILGREQGLCRGRGGSMHVADMSVGMLGANGIVGAGVAIALGSALAHKTLGRHAVAVAFFGDGALAEGLLHESMNLASLWHLPLLFVCENNGWSEFSPSSAQIAFKLEALSGAHQIAYGRVNGNDVEAVSAAAANDVAALRQGNGPRLLECVTNRVRGHFEGDAQKYRNSDDIAALPTHDPLRLIRERLDQRGVLASVITSIDQQVGAELDAAVSAARRGSDPNFENALVDVYTPAGRQ